MKISVNTVQVFRIYDINTFFAQLKIVKQLILCGVE